MKETRKEKEEERKWDGTCAPGGLLRKRLGSCIWGNPLTSGEIAITEGELQGLRGKPSYRSEACRTVRPMQMVCHSHVLPSLTCVSASADGE